MFISTSHIQFFFSDVDYDPRKISRDERKARIEKHEKRQQQNVTSNLQRKSDIEKTLATTRISTASMGKFDKRLEGEKKLRGVKRKAGLCYHDGCNIFF